MRFGSLSDRELDIAEATFRAAVAVIIEMARGGIPPDLISRSALGGDVRERLREKLEAAP